MAPSPKERLGALRPTGQQRFLQVLVGVGPVFSFFAACPLRAYKLKQLPRARERPFKGFKTWHNPVKPGETRYIWCFHRDETNLAELLAPLAYVSNGIAVGIMTIFVKVEEQAQPLETLPKTI